MIRFQRASAALVLLTRAGWGLLLAVMLVAGSSGQVPSAGSPDARMLDGLLNRAATTAAGTYIVVDGTLQPALAAIPLVVQADAFRGADHTIRVAVALGAEMPQAALGRFLVVTASGSAGAAPRVVADAVVSAQPGQVRVVREFTLIPGEYEIQAAVGYPRPEGGVIAALAKSRLTVPDVWNGPLAVSPLMLGDAVSAAPRTPDTRAFNFGPTALTPATSDRFAQDGDLHVAFRIYNWTAARGEKPDLAVEYVFYQQTARRQAFFNKTKPQRMAGDTLGQGFDPAAGMVTAGMTIPLASFPFGEFQLRARITDNRTKQSAEQQVRFTVAP